MELEDLMVDCISFHGMPGRVKSWDATEIVDGNEDPVQLLSILERLYVGRSIAASECRL